MFSCTLTYLYLGLFQHQNQDPKCHKNAGAGLRAACAAPFMCPLGHATDWSFSLSLTFDPRSIAQSWPGKRAFNSTRRWTHVSQGQKVQGGSFGVKAFSVVP